MKLAYFLFSSLLVAARWANAVDSPIATKPEVAGDVDKPEVVGDAGTKSLRGSAKVELSYRRMQRSDVSSDKQLRSLQVTVGASPDGNSTSVDTMDGEAERKKDKKSKKKSKKQKKRSKKKNSKKKGKSKRGKSKRGKKGGK